MKYLKFFAWFYKNGKSSFSDKTNEKWINCLLNVMLFFFLSFSIAGAQSSDKAGNYKYYKITPCILYFSKRYT